MWQRICYYYFYITSCIYCISLLQLLLRQDNEYSIIIFTKVIATTTTETTTSHTFTTRTLGRRHHIRLPSSSSPLKHSLYHNTPSTIVTTNKHTIHVVPYSFIPHLPRRQFHHHQRHPKLLGSLRRLAKNKSFFCRREFFIVQPSILRSMVLQQQQQSNSTMASTAAAATTTSNDVEIKNAKVIQQCRILCISDPNDPNNQILYNNDYHVGNHNDTDSSSSMVVQHITSNLIMNDENELQSLVDIVKDKQINTIFISDASAQSILAYLLPRLSDHQNQGSSTSSSSSSSSSIPSEDDDNEQQQQQQSIPVQQQHPIVWIHSRSAGIDSYLSPELIKWYQQGTTTSSTTTSNVQMMTNAKGMFSSTLAEYSMGACTYFSKDFHRLKRNQQQRSWEKYSVSELRGSTMGIIGYGDIGRATARLAKAYGMNVLALVRQSRSSSHDEYANVLITNDVSNNDGLNRIFIESDYILCALPLTESTYHCIGKQQFALCKPNCVFINVGRGPIVDEDALIKALQNQQLKGAALDVFTIEPLPVSSPLWDMDNVLMSPHNMDQTDTFLIESTTFFVKEQIPRFIRGLPLLNHVNPSLGY